jgi:hypothetical protein
MNWVPNRFVVIGFKSEAVIAYFVEFLSLHGFQYQLIDLDSEVMDFNWSLRLTANGLIWSNSTSCQIIPLEIPIYHRFFVRPEADPACAQRLQDAFDIFTAYCNYAPDSALIVNRPLSGVMNWAKMAHMRSLAEFGFKIPEALATNERWRLEQFRKPAISKGCSGMRSIARRRESVDLDNLSARLQIPTMLQQYISGPDIRVHFIGYENVALKIETEFDDYRYASRNGFEISVVRTTLLNELADKCWAYMKSERLEFAGFDFKVDVDGIWWLLEINPMPGFAFFDKHCEFLISKMLYRKLCRGYGTFSAIEGQREVFIDADRLPAIDRGGSTQV